MNEDFPDFDIPQKEKQKKTDPKLCILMLQLTACIILAAAAVALKYFGGEFYSDVREKYITMFEDTTTAEEVMAIVRSGGAPPQTDYEQTVSSAPAESADPAVSSEQEETSSVQSDDVSSAVSSGLGEAVNTSLSFSFDKINSYSAMSVSRLNSLYTPVSGAVSSEYGWRVNPVTGIYALHSGIDIAADSGAPACAALGGTVSESGTSPSYGIYVLIKHSGSIETMYAHLSAAKVKEGDKVSRGQIIGLVGSTGNSTGPHLHFEVRVGGKSLDPRYLLSGLANG